MSKPLAAGALLMLTGLASQVGAAPSVAPERLLTSFAPDASVGWYTVNDNVMGGRSRGGFQIMDGVLRFAGSTNTNGGGFSSLRTRPVRMDLAGFEGMRLRLRADGRRYTFRLTTRSSQQGRRSAPTYWADFKTIAGSDWQTINVPFTRFAPRWRGRQLSGPALDLTTIDTLGLMIYDKRDGPFRLEVDSIHAYSAEAAFNLNDLRWRKRPLVVFAPSYEDARLAALLNDVLKQRGGVDERGMAIVVVTPESAAVDGTPLASGDARALRERYGVDARTFELFLIGKDGGVKRRSNDRVNLADLFAQIDGMAMRQREMRDTAAAR